MLNSITLEDFKCFSVAEFPLAPLTVLTGTNSVGKSTILQALLLTRSACLKAMSGSNIVPLNGPIGLSLGQFDDVLRRNLDVESQEILISVVDDSVEFDLTLMGDGDRYAQFEFVNDLCPPSLSKEGLGQFVYLSSDRAGPRNNSPIQSVPKEQLSIDYKGELIADVLFQCERDEVNQSLEHPTALGQRLLKQAEAWLSTFVPDVKIRVDQTKELDLATLRFMRGGVSSEWERPSNTGFGVSYCLPIIVAGLTASANSILIVESPEAHMHPSAQSAMGSFLGRLAASGVQVFVETHSDHIVNGIRRAAVDANHPLARTDVVMNHLSLRNNELVKDEIRITAAGSLTSHPPEFFDQTEIDLSAIVKTRFPSERP